MKSRAWLFFVFAMVSASAAGAQTPEARAQAAAKFREAQSAFAMGSYRASALAFEAAAELAPHPSVWLNAAEAWELAGEPLRAANDCERALAVPGVANDIASEAKKRLDRLASKLGQIELTGESTLRVALDDETPGPVPVTRWVAPGSHRLAIIDGDQRRELEVEVGAGLRRTIELGSLAPRTSGSAEPPPLKYLAPPSSDASPPAGAWVSFGVAGVAFVGTATFGGLTLSSVDDFDAAPTRENADAFYRHRTLTNVTLGVGLGAALVGAVFWIVDATDDDASSVAMTANAGEASLLFRRAW